MHLFKRLLLTKFPNSTIHNVVNPASMFIGFISAKEFFSIINRKIIENYKLNLFDVNLDPVEFKTWFWEQQKEWNNKDIETYYAYAVAANLNWTLFFSPANLWNAIALLSSVYFKDAMSAYPSNCFTQLIYIIYLLSFTFASRVKVFPSDKEQENYNWFIDVFFDAYKSTFDQLQVKITKKELDKIKKSLLQETPYFFLLFHFYKKLNSLLEDKWDDLEYLDWLFWKTKSQDTTLIAFKSNYWTTKYLPHSSPLEQSILNRVWPADILIKYLFWDADPFLAVETIVEKIFDKNELDPIVSSFVKWDKELPRLLQYLLEYKRYKYGFFAWVQNYMIRLMRKDWKEEYYEDIDEMLSAIDNWDDISNFDIPEKIKRESKVTERLLNFYITLLGWFATARWDSFYLRLFKPGLVESFSKVLHKKTTFKKRTTKEYYEAILYEYSNVLYYYVYIDQHIRSWKTKFTIPSKTAVLDTTINTTVANLFLEGMIAAHFQDLNPKDTRLTIKNSQIIEKFKEKFWGNIQDLVKKTGLSFLMNYYLASIGLLTDWEKLIWILKNNTNDQDYVNLKDSLYKLDYRISDVFLRKLSKLSLNTEFDDVVLLPIYWTIRETLLWLALLLVYLKKKNTKWVIDKNGLLQLLYVREVLMFQNTRKEEWVYNALFDTIKELEPLLEIWCWLDDNQQFFDLFERNWKSYIDSHKIQDLYKDLSIDDIVRFRWLLKNITYYNKRYIIPW